MWEQLSAGHLGDVCLELQEKSFPGYDAAAWAPPHLLRWAFSLISWHVFRSST